MGRDSTIVLCLSISAVLDKQSSRIMKKLNIAMIGYKFMGKAHSNAWRQVSRFFDTPFEPVMKVICGRNEQEVKRAAHTYGWEGYSSSWEEVVRRKDIDVIDICTPGDLHMPVAVAAAMLIGLAPNVEMFANVPLSATDAFARVRPMG